VRTTLELGSEIPQSARHPLPKNMSQSTIDHFNRMRELSDAAGIDTRSDEVDFNVWDRKVTIYAPGKPEHGEEIWSWKFANRFPEAMLLGIVVFDFRPETKLRLEEEARRKA
jgi:hypothetical protein